QIQRNAFDDLKRFGYFKDTRYEDLTPQGALAAAMKYKTVLAENYGLTHPGWNIFGFKEGPTIARKLQAKYKDDILSATMDPEFPASGKTYIMKTLQANRELKKNPPPALIREMYEAIIRGDDVEKIDIKKYVPKKEYGGFLKKYQEGAEVTEEPNPWKGFGNKMLFLPGMTQHTAPFAPLASTAADAIGMSPNADKSSMAAGTIMSGVSGFLSAGPVGAALGLGSGLVKYGFHAADQAKQKQAEEEAYLKSRTISGRDGLDGPLTYMQKGGPVPTQQPNNGYNVDKAVKSQAGKYVNKVYQFGGYSTEGYKEDSPDRDNDYNVIPSNVITMEGVRKALRAIPISNGIPLGEIE